MQELVTLGLARRLFCVFFQLDHALVAGQWNIPEDADSSRDVVVGVDGKSNTSVGAGAVMAWGHDNWFGYQVTGQHATVIGVGIVRQQPVEESAWATRAWCFVCQSLARVVKW